MSIIENFTNLVRHIRNGEHFEFYEEIIQYVDKHKNVLGNLLKLWVVFVNIFKKEDDIYKRSQKVSETRFITKAEAERQDAFMVIKRGVEMASYKKTPDEKAAAENLAFVLDNFKQIPRASQIETSALILNLVQDLRRPPYAADVQTLGLTESVNALEEANEAFKTLYEERELDIKKAEMMGNMTQIRPLTDKAFLDFTDALGALCVAARLDGKTAEAAALEDIVVRINATIRQYKAVYGRRGGAASPGKPVIPDTPDTPEAPEDNIPILSVASQEIAGQNNSEIHVVLADAAAFALALYPAAQGGLLRLRTDVEGVEPEEAAFYITGFITDASSGEEKPVGLKMSVPADHVLLSFDNAGPCEAWVEKDNQTLARILGLVYGGMFTLD
jgi:hypothetical protein